MEYGLREARARLAAVEANGDMVEAARVRTHIAELERMEAQSVREVPPVESPAVTRRAAKPRTRKTVSG